jgi:hypothetical protein
MSDPQALRKQLESVLHDIKLGRRTMLPELKLNSGDLTLAEIACLEQFQAVANAYKECLSRTWYLFARDTEIEAYQDE